MIHVEADPASIFYKSPDGSAQILYLTDTHITASFQAALVMIFSKTQRSSKTRGLAQGEVIIQVILSWFYSGKFLTDLQI